MNVNYSRGLSKNKPQSNLDQCGADIILHMTRVLLGISSLRSQLFSTVQHVQEMLT